MTTSVHFTGTGTALVTPFQQDGAFDAPAYHRLIDTQVEGGVEALIVLGTTGENPTVTPDERSRIVETAIRASDGRVPVIVGTGSNNTRESIAFARQAAAAGADGQLVVGPYYNKPTQAGFRAHVAAIAGAADLPVLLYNVPGRTSLNLTAETVLRLAEEIPAVFGVKEASGNLDQIMEILAHRPAGFAVYSGDDALTFPLVALGADGVVSVISNALPGRFSTMVRAALGGDLVRARRMHYELLPAMQACFYETNPIPIKAVLAERGLIAPSLRLPLLAATGESRRRILGAFEPYLSLHA